MADRAKTSLHIPVAKHRLDNGLTVLLAEDHRLPQVAVNLWYHVGSKDEKPGKTGFAHLFEHMMFQGSEHFPDDFFRPLEEVGARLNGSTSEDRTNYWEVVPTAYLERALWLESDRMGHLLPAMDQAKLDNQRDVVKNERRQTVENQPYGVAEEALLTALYPEGHPYHHSVIGSMEDLDRASLEDVKAFFARYYTPNNASLCLAGDFDPPSALAFAERYFGDIPSGPVLSPAQPWMPLLSKPVRVSVEDQVRLSRLYLQWPGPAQFTRDAAALSVLGYVLGTGKDSRLIRRLQVDNSVAQALWAYNQAGEISGAFSVVITVQQGRSLAEAEHAMWEELERLKRDGVEASEVRAAVDAIRSGVLKRLQTPGGFGGVSDMLNRYQVFLGDPEFLPRDFAVYESLSAEEVAEAARRYLPNDRHVALAVTPPRVRPAVVADRTAIPGPGREGFFSFPHAERFILETGIEVWVCPQLGLPLVTAAVFGRLGAAFDPEARPGLSRLSADMLDENAADMGPVELAARQKSLATALSTYADADFTSLTITLLTEHLEGGLSFLADVAARPGFLREDFERLRKEQLSDLERRKDDADQLSEWALRALLFGPRAPYGHPVEGTASGLEAATLDEARSLYEERWLPASSVLVLVGDVEAGRAREWAERAFGGWKREGSALPADASSDEDRAGLFLLDKPLAAQAVVATGLAAIGRSDPAYPAFMVFNAVLGGQFTSRVNLNLREDKGYTYGARSYVNLQRGIMPWVLTAAVQADKAVESLAEMRSEIEGILSTRPITAAEFEKARDSLVLRYPQSFETQAQLSSSFGSLWVHEFALEFHERILESLKALTLEEVQEAGARFVVPERLAWVVVGDAASLEPKLEGAGLGKPQRMELPE